MIKAKLIPEMALKREVLGWFIIIKARNSYFTDYYKRYGNKKKDIYCKCGQKRSKSYPFSCLSTKVLKVKPFNIIN